MAKCDEVLKGSFMEMWSHFPQDVSNIKYSIVNPQILFQDFLRHICSIIINACQCFKAVQFSWKWMSRKHLLYCQCGINGEG